MSEQTLARKILEYIKKEDPQAFGSLSVRKIGDEYYVSGQVSTALTDETVLEQGIIAMFPKGSEVRLTKLFNRGLTVAATDSIATTEDPLGELDEVDVLYYGLLPANKILENKDFKRVNHETIIKVKRAIELVGFVAPLVLDSTFKIIDGGLRLRAVRLLYGEDTSKKIPVIVINDAGAKADFLRLALNRSSEFQRWHYKPDEANTYRGVDDFVDAYPQLQPILEPMGFFSNKILPTSFFGNTVADYTIDEYNDQMKQYSQDIGLAKWAEMQREKALAAEAKKQAALAKRKTPTQGMTSLFDMVPKEEDFIPTYDIQSEMRTQTLEMREMAGEITEKYDAKRKAEKEAKGQDWQTSRRGSKQKAADKRAEAEAQLLVDSDVTLGEDELYED